MLGKRASDNKENLNCNNGRKKKCQITYQTLEQPSGFQQSSHQFFDNNGSFYHNFDTSKQKIGSIYNTNEYNFNSYGLNNDCSVFSPNIKKQESYSPHKQYSLEKHSSHHKMTLLESQHMQPTFHDQLMYKNQQF